MVSSHTPVDPLRRGGVGPGVHLGSMLARNKSLIKLELAENALGPGSYRPDDIIRMHSGKTVEVIDTGALALCHSAIALLSISL